MISYLGVQAREIFAVMDSHDVSELTAARIVRDRKAIRDQLQRQRASLSRSRGK